MHNLDAEIATMKSTVGDVVGVGQQAGHGSEKLSIGRVHANLGGQVGQLFHGETFLDPLNAGGGRNAEAADDMFGKNFQEL